jgi:hypothetical protein
MLTGYLMCLVATIAPAETLCNGIELPEAWPPRIKELSMEPGVPPYLKAPPAVIPIDVGRQLFVDDFLIEQTTLKRTFHAARCHPASPLLVPDRPWEQKGDWRGYIGPHAMPFSDGVWYDPKDRLFKMWYMAGVLDSTCLATSKDGVHWEKPDWGVVPGTNVVHPGNRDSCTIWFDQDEKDPLRRYKMFRFQKSPKRGLVIQFSPDGIRWGKEARWAGPCNDRTTVFYNPFRQVWVYSLKLVGPVAGVTKEERLRRYWEQKDVLTSPMWSKPDQTYLWCACDRLDPHRADSDIGPPKVYNLDAVAYESVLLGAFSVLQTNYGKDNQERPKRNEVFLGFSRDGFHWYRPQPARRAFVAVSEKRGDWNWGNVQSAGGVCLIVGGELYFYVSGRAGTARLGPQKSHRESDASTGLAILRRDGFASMDAGADEGTLTTRPLRFSGEHLFVNVAAADGELRVEILGDNGEVIRPFGCDACTPVRVDKTLARITWRGATDLAGVAGRPVRFRFHLRSGRLYSFWVSPDESGASHGYVAAGGPGFTGPTDTVGTGADASGH